MTHADIVNSALRHLRDGRDVVIVALYPADTFRIADAVRAWAMTHNVPCVLSERRDDPQRRDADVPLIIARPYLWPAERTPKFRARPIVMVHSSAILERPCHVPPKYRRVHD